MFLFSVILLELEHEDEQLEENPGLLVNSVGDGAHGGVPGTEPVSQLGEPDREQPGRSEPVSQSAGPDSGQHSSS